MIDNITTYVLGALLILLGFAVYIILAAFVLPKCFLRPKYKEGEADRGVKKYTFPEGRSIIYEPSSENLRYIEQYLLCSADGMKYIKCKVREGVFSLRYYIKVFDARGKIIKVLEVRDPVSSKEYTERVLLPSDTSYVSVDVRSACGKRLARADIASYTNLNVIIYTLLNVILSVAESACVARAVLSIADLLVSYSSLVEITGYTTATFAGGIIGMLSTILMLYFYRGRDIALPEEQKKGQNT